jgi:single-strand DNA-binding protein
MFNEIILAGHLGKDPEMRFTQNQTAVCNFSLATTKTKPDGSKHTDWHQIVVWGKPAENCSKYLTKGSPVLLRGEISYEEFTDKTGVKKIATKITAHQVTFLPNANKNQTEKAQHQEDDFDPETIPW